MQLNPPLYKYNEQTTEIVPGAFMSNLISPKASLLALLAVLFADNAYAQFVPITNSQIDPQSAEVIDTKTSLVWRRCSEGQTWNNSTCTSSAASFSTWKAALDLAKTQAITDWRLPSVKELSSLADRSRVNPAIDVLAFPATPSDYYWTSSPNATSPGSAWHVFFGYGSADNSVPGKYVRLVRNALPSEIEAANKLQLTQFSDEFDGTILQNTYWTHIKAGINLGAITLSGGLANFAAWGLASTEDKVTFSGSKIVIEARFAGLGGNRDTHIDLVDVSTNEYIMLGDTNYLSWGFYTQGSGKFNFKEVSSWAGSHNGINVATNGITTNQFKEYRITIDGNTVKVERGGTLENITETMTKTLGSSIVGRTFYLRIGTASPSFSPGTHDWIRVATY